MKKRIYTFMFFAAVVIIFLNFPALFAQDFNKEIYTDRRHRLMEQIEDGIVVIKNSKMALRNNDVNYYPYQANTDFYYLTGFEEPEAAFILDPSGEKRFVMFLKTANAMASMWFGDLPGIEGAIVTFGADTAYAIDKFEDILRGFLRRHKKIYIDLRNEDMVETVHSLLPRRTGSSAGQLIDVIPLVHEMRVIKGPEEIDLIRKSVDIACAGHLEVMKAVEPGMFEYEIEAIFSYIFQKNGSQRKAYESIVASGPNATILHYSDVSRQSQNGELVMMDMGADFAYYASDITRVIPVNGKFTKAQRDLYEIVLEMEDAIIAYMIPGNKWFDCLSQGEEIAKKGLHRLGLITDRDSPWQHTLYYFAYCGHPIGLDVHDVGEYGGFHDGGRVLEPGMVFAVEPLLYVGENLVEGFRSMAIHRYSALPEEVDAFLEEINPVFEKYLHVAARVEDNILITEDGNEVLSPHLPRTVEDIEKTMRQKSYLNR